MKTTKLNILITASTFPRWRGDSTPNFVQQFAYAISDDLNVTVLAPHFKGAKKAEADGPIMVRRYQYFYPSTQENITYNGGGVDKIKKSPLYALKLACLIAALFFHTLWIVVSKRIDVINPHWIIPQGFVAIMVKFLTRRKVVLTVHGGDVFSLTGSVMTRVKRFVLRHSDAVCVNSTATKDACNEILKRDYKVIPMGIDMARFLPKERSQKLVKEHKLAGFTILYVGRFARIKGVMYLVRALKLLDDSGCDFKAIIAGEGPLKREIEEYIVANNLSGKVVLPGWINQEDLNDYYSVADVLVGPSLSEAQGLVFVEALASGTPVIASKVGGIIDIVSEGKTGFLVTPQSEEQLYEKLKEVIDHPSLLKQFAANARPTVEQKFSWTDIGDRYKQTIIERVINDE